MERKREKSHAQRLKDHWELADMRYGRWSVRGVIAIFGARRISTFLGSVRACGEGPNGILQPGRSGLEHRRDVVLNSRTDFGNLLVDW